MIAIDFARRRAKARRAPVKRAKGGTMVEPLRIVALAAAMACAAPAVPMAHHSYAMFDAGKTLTVSGTVAKVEWTNPHVFIWVYVPKPEGGYAIHAFESDSVNRLAGLGWTHASLGTGDKAQFVYHPLRDGRPGGKLMKTTLANGTVLNTTPLTTDNPEPKP